MAEVGNKEFHQRLNILQQLRNAWQSGLKVAIVMADNNEIEEDGKTAVDLQQLDNGTFCKQFC